MKRQKHKNSLAAAVAVLVIILAALGLMFAATIYYRNREPQESASLPSSEKQTVKIPDITNPPKTAEPAEQKQTTAAENQSQSEGQSLAEDLTAKEQNGESEQTGDSGTAEENITAEEDVITEGASSGEAGGESETSADEAPIAGPLSAEEYAAKANELTMEKAGSHLVDLTAFTAPTADGLIAMIESYTVPDKPYLDGAERTDGDFSYPIARRNLGGIHDPVELRYGILTANASVRAYPTWQKLSDGTSAEDPDYLQETMLSAGEGVIVLHQSEDQIWSFVQASCYYGWIETSVIGFCTKEEMTAFIMPEEFVVVTELSAEVGTVHLRMGTKLPLAGEEDQAYLVRVPQADREGKLTVLEADVDPGYFSKGYLSLSAEAIVGQARKLLGTNYGWGDSNEYMDCTSTLRAVYNCFGVTLPRNSSWMPNCALKVTDLREADAEEKKEAIASLAPGSILLINGHAMMYIGQEDGKESMLHNVTRYLPAEGGELVRPMKCVITPIDICNSAGVSYLELYRYAISIDWDVIR